MTESSSPKKALVTQSATLFAFFIVFTILAKVIDVGPIGFGGAPVGFSHINGAFNKIFGYNGLCFRLSEYLGYICLMVAGLYAVFALISFIRAKSLKGMDRSLLVTMCFYAVVVFFYILFNYVVINVRPTEAEASYPSSHTMLGLCVLYSASVLMGEKTPKGLKILCYVAMAAMVVLRLLSGVHWLTDIVGAIILSASLILGYRAFVD